MIKYILFVVLLLVSSVDSVILKTWTVGESQDHATLAACETAHEQNLVTNDSALTYSIENDIATTGYESGAITVDGSITDATRNITIKTTGTQRHDGVFNTGIYYILAASTNGLVVSDSHVVIDGLQFHNTGSGSYDYSLSISADCEVFSFSNCIIDNDGTTGPGLTGFSQGNEPTGQCYFFNNIIYVTNGVAISAGGPDGALAVQIYNNTIVNSITAIDYGYQDGRAINNIFYGNTTDISGGTHPTYPSEYNASDQASITYQDCTGNCGTGDVLSISDPFLDEVNDDYRLASGSDIEDAGNGAEPHFTIDIIGTTRPVVDLDWDIGAFEFVASGSPRRIIYQKYYMGEKDENKNWDFAILFSNDLINSRLR